jgi:hypothetical protein
MNTTLSSETTLERAFRFLAADNAAIGFTMDTASLAAGGPIVFISTEAQWGKLRIRIQNSTAAPVPFDTAALVKICMKPLLSTAEIARIRVAGADWSCQPMEDRLEIKPLRAGAIPANGSATIDLTQVLGSGEAATGHFRFEYAGFDGKSGGQRVTVFRQNPPGSGRVLPLTQDLGARVEYAQQARTVYFTPAGAPPIKNHLTLQVANTDAAHPIRLADGGKPKIVLSFVSGTSRSSICADDQLKSVEVSIRQTDGVQWDVEKDSTGPVPVWNLRPKAGSETLFSAGGVISFQIGNLETRLEPGWASPMFLQFAGVPGYDDSYTALLLQKTEPVPYVRRFLATSNGTPVAYDATLDYGQELLLSWDVFAAAVCHISGVGSGLAAKGAQPVTANQLTVTYSLISEIAGRHSPATSLQFRVPPSSASLKASATLVKAGQEIELSWECGSGVCTLTGDGPAPVTVTRKGARKVKVGQPTPYTVTCAGVTRTSSTASVIVVPEADVGIQFYNPFPLGMGPPTFAWKISWWTRWATSCVITNVRTGEVFSTDLGGQVERPLPTQDFADHMSGRDCGKYVFRMVVTGPGGTVTVERGPG